MLRILDRYVLRELLAPFTLSLLLLTFALEIPPILQYGETLIAEGASWDIVVRVLARWCRRRWASPFRGALGAFHHVGPPLRSPARSWL